MERVHCAGFEGTEFLFHLGSALLDEVEVGWVGWPIELCRTRGFDEFPHSPGLDAHPGYTEVVQLRIRP